MGSPVKSNTSTVDADKMESPEGLCLLINLQQSASSDAAPPLAAASTAQPQFLQDANRRRVGLKDGPRQFNFRPVHPLFFSLRIRFYRRGASVWEHGGFRREMSAVHAGYVAKREHHCVEAALHRGGVGTRVVLQLHHFCRDSVPHPVRSAGVEAALLSVQRTRRVSDRSLLLVQHDSIRPP